MLNLKTISVIGANGTMGASVAGLLAAFGNARVFLICRKRDAALKAVETAVNSVKADDIRGRLIPKTYDDFGDCISQSDWVFETVAENMAVKSEIYRKISEFRKPDTLVTTGTSGFSINTLAKSLDTKSRPYFFGTHFFNPPYSLTLCEVIRSRETDTELFNEMGSYLKDVLYRDIIEVSDTPAFLGNRIGFHFMNKALQYAVRYVKEGGIEYMDAILGPFTGRGMTPLVTVDFGGLDVHKAIVDNIHDHSRDYDNTVFMLPDFIEILINEGKLGQKTGEGLFKTIVNEDGSTAKMVYDIDSGEFRPARKFNLPFAKEMVAQLAVGNYNNAFESLKSDTSKEAMICKHFLISYITYGIVIAQAVSAKITDADVAMSAGFSWMGPVSFMQAFGGFGEVVKMAQQVDIFGNLVEQLNGITDKNKKLISVPLDFRKYLRAKL